MRKIIILTIFTAVFTASCGKAIVSAARGAGKAAPKVAKIPKRVKPGHIPPAPVPDHIPPGGTATSGSGKTAGKTAAEGTGRGIPISTRSLGSTLKSGAKKPAVSKAVKSKPSGTSKSSLFQDESLLGKTAEKTAETGLNIATEVGKDPLANYLDNMFDSNKTAEGSSNPLDGFWFYFIQKGNKKYGMAVNRVNGKEGGYMMIVEGETQAYLEFTGKNSVGIEGSNFRLNRTFENIIIDQKIYDKNSYSDLRFNFMLYKMASDTFTNPSNSVLVKLYGKNAYRASGPEGKLINWTKTTKERFAAVRSLWRYSQSWK